MQSAAVRSILTIVICSLFACSSRGRAGSDSHEDHEDNATESFTNGGTTLDARTTTSGDTMTTTISLDGQVVLEMGTTRDGVTLVFPSEGPEEESLPFATPLDELPNATASNHLGVYIVGTLLLGDGGAPDNPGCDWFPDTRCTLGCCATHDACYAAEDPPCRFTSWIPFVGSAACKACNRAAVGCIVGTCFGLRRDHSGDLPSPDAGLANADAGADAGDEVPTGSCSYEDTNFNIYTGTASLTEGPRTGEFQHCYFTDSTEYLELVLWDLDGAPGFSVTVLTPGRSAFSCADEVTDYLHVSYTEGEFGLAAYAATTSGSPVYGTCSVTVTDTEDRWTGTFSAHMVSVIDVDQSADIEGSAEVVFTPREDRPGF